MSPGLPGDPPLRRDRGAAVRWSIFLLGLAAAIPAAPTTVVPCIPGDVSIEWPSPGIDIPSNPQFRVFVCGGVDPARYGPFLETEADRIPLRVTKGPIDADRWTLEPEYPLRPATLYRMAFVALPKGFDFEHEGWTTLDTVDRTPPVWTKLPAVSDTESIREEMVTDHQTSAAIVFDAGDEGWLAALLQVERPGEAKPSDPAPTWLVPLWQRQNGSFRVYAPCASCATGDVRLVRLTLLDLAGNRSATRSVRFRVPPLPSPPRSHVVTTLDPPTTVRRLVEPAYTVIAQRARIQGTAEGTLAVDATGVVTVVEIQKTLRFGLDEATVEALLQWKFPPAETPTRQYAFTSRFQLVQEVYAPKWGVDPP